MISRPPAGLTETQAATMLALEGHNDLPAGKRSSPLALAGEGAREPMFALLLGAGALYAAIGDLGEALMLLLFATISVSIGIIQRGRSERVLDALRDLTSPRAQVVRDGQRKRIPGRDVATSCKYVWNLCRRCCSVQWNPPLPGDSSCRLIRKLWRFLSPACAARTWPLLAEKTPRWAN